MHGTAGCDRYRTSLRPCGASRWLEGNGAILPYVPEEDINIYLHSAQLAVELLVAAQCLGDLQGRQTMQSTLM